MMTPTEVPQPLPEELAAHLSQRLDEARGVSSLGNHMGKAWEDGEILGISWGYTGDMVI